MSILVRLARYEDRTAAVAAETKAVRGLHYLDDVWDLFFRDQSGELLVGEVEGKVVAVGKYTLLYDSSAWLETLRVDPEYQSRGIGKAFYTRFLERAAFQGVRSLGMYTGTSNQVSKGLAERFGFRLAAAYRGASWKAGAEQGSTPGEQDPWQGFVPLSPGQAVAQLTPLAATWDGHLIMNRTFYPANAATFAGMAREGKVFYHPLSGSICVLGYRFLGERGLHLALAAGDIPRILAFSKARVEQLALPQVTIMFPPAEQKLQEQLLAGGFVLEAADCIVMERHG
ncbi:MAG: GNAT family N-acetyltransferase [Symbiobacteriaceae bacterium]|nr:GNAT family N-acetyltransferase [Symbiobacteriaceae bacterium]